jgi:Putative Ig domain/IPT/TIG domain
MNIMKLKNKFPGKLITALWLIGLTGALLFASRPAFAATYGNGYVKCSGAHGGTTFVYSDSVGGTKLAQTSLIQFLYAGADGVISPPDASGNPTGDDQLITTGTVGTPWSTDGEFFYYLDAMTDNAKIYVRVWNAASLSAATKYGDSAVYTINGGLPKPTPFTWNVTDSSHAGGLATDKNKPGSIPPAPTPLSISNTSLPGGAVGTAYSQTLSASGGTAPYTWTISSGSLPVGLTLSAAGIISGTPAATQTANFTSQVADSALHTATQPLSITVVTTGSASLSVISVSPAASPTGTKIRLTLVSGRSFGAAQSNSLICFINKTTLANFTSVNTVKWSDTTIEAIVPSLASGLYDVKVLYVQNAGGVLQEYDSNPAGFQITGSFGFGSAATYPSPFNPGAESVTIAVADPGGAANLGFYVFDRTARLVFKQVLAGVNQTSWNGLDQNGNIVGDGAYLVRIVNEDTKALLAKGKLLAIKH